WHGVGVADQRAAAILGIGRFQFGGEDRLAPLLAESIRSRLGLADAVGMSAGLLLHRLAQLGGRLARGLRAGPQSAEEREDQAAPAQAQDGQNAEQGDEHGIERAEIAVAES